MFAVLQGDIVIAFAQVHSLASMMVMFEKDIVENFMRLLRDCVNKVLGEADGCVQARFTQLELISAGNDAR